MIKRKVRRVPQIITDEQLQRIIVETLKSSGQCSKKFVPMRNITMFLMSYYMGLRPGEIRLMKISEIDFDNGTLFLKAENNKQRNEENDFPMPRFMTNLLFNYVKKIPFKTEWLFPSFRHPNKPIDSRNHQRAFTDVAKRLNLLRVSYIDGQNKPRYNLTLYSFRHRFGDYCYEKFCYDIQKTALMLRHYDMSCRTTLRYVHTASRVKRRELMNELYNKKLPEEII